MAKPAFSAQRRAAHDLLRRGVMDLTDIARLLGTSAQLVRYWAKTGGLDDYRARRAAFKRKTAAAALKRAHNRTGVKHGLS